LLGVIVLRTPAVNVEVGDMEKQEKSRRISIYPTVGQEGKAIEKNLYAGKTLAVFTSGGDAQGTKTFSYLSRIRWCHYVILNWPDMHVFRLLRKRATNRWVTNVWETDRLSIRLGS